MKKNRTIVSVIIGFLFSGYIFADLPEPDSFDPMDSLVIIKNPQLYRHGHCIGVAITSYTVITASECVVSGIGTELTVFEKPEDLSDGVESGNKVDSVDLKLFGTQKVAQLYLTQPLKSRESASFSLPEISSKTPLFYYYLAARESALMVKKRAAEYLEAQADPGTFTVFIAEDFSYVTGDFLWGAVIFDADNRLVGVSFDQTGLFTFLGGEVVFRKVTMENRWGGQTDTFRNEL